LQLIFSKSDKSYSPNGLMQNPEQPMVLLVKYTVNQGIKMQTTDLKILTRIRNGETQAHIDSETKRLNNEGIAVMYFNSQSSYDDWFNRFQALSR